MLLMPRYKYIAKHNKKLPGTFKRGSFLYFKPIQEESLNAVFQHGTHALSTNIVSGRLSVALKLNLLNLNVGHPHAVSFTVGVANIMTKSRRFTAYITFAGQFRLPPLRISFFAVSLSPNSAPTKRWVTEEVV
jgi:hypothetical protein